MSTLMRWWYLISHWQAKNAATVQSNALSIAPTSDAPTPAALNLLPVRADSRSARSSRLTHSLAH
jgi:hypothetical protein